VGGTSTGTPSVVTLFRIALPAAAGGTTATMIDTHPANFQVTPDDLTVYYNKGDGSLWRYDLAASKTSAVAPSGVLFAIGPKPGQLLAYVAADRSVHVVDGTGAAVYSAPAGAVDLFSPLLFSDDGQHLYFFQNVDSEDDHGDLYHAALPPAAAAAPQLVQKDVGLSQLRTVGGHLVYLANVDAIGATGDLSSAALDGTGATKLAGMADTFEDKVAPDQMDVAPTLFANLLGPVTDTSSTHLPIDNSNPVVGALAVTVDLTVPEKQLFQSTHAGTGYALSDDGKLVAWADTVAWDSTAMNFVGTLRLYDASLGVPSPTSLAGVSEVGPITARSFFVNAPLASPAGVYLVKY
jgi:hypothetical protein